MSKVVSVRLSEELAKKLEGRKVSEVVTEALERYFDPPVERKRGAMKEEGLVLGGKPAVSEGQARAVSSGKVAGIPLEAGVGECPHGHVSKRVCKIMRGGCEK